MRRSPTGFAAALLFALAACGDSAGPVRPRQLVIVSGNNQSASVGAALTIPFTVNVVGTDNDPFPGAIVTWTVTAGAATAQPATSVTSAEGDATTSLVLGFEAGPVQVTASVAGAPPVVFAASATYDFPCQVFAAIAPVGFTGTLDSGDCDIDGYFHDVVGFSLPSQQSFSIRMVSGNVDTWVALHGGDGTFLAANDDSLLATVNRTSFLNAIVAPGGYLLTTSTQQPGQTGSYSLVIQGRPAVLEGCDANIDFTSLEQRIVSSDRSAVWLTRGVAFNEVITPNDCVVATGPFYSDRALIMLESGSELTVRQASTDFDAYIKLTGPNAFSAFNDDSANVASVTNAYLTVEAPSTGIYLLELGTAAPGATGNYHVSIASGATSAPAVNLGASVGALLRRLRPRPH